MKLKTAFNLFIKYQTAQNKPATINSYIDRTRTFRQGFGESLYDIANVSSLISDTGLYWLLRGHEERPLADIAPEDIDDWLLILNNQHTLYVGNLRPNTESGLSKATIEGRKQSIKSFFSFCEDRAYILRSPAKHIRRSNVSKKSHVKQKVMSLYDLYRIMDIVKERAKQGNSRDLAIVCLMVESGIRPGELVKLNVKDLDLTRYEALVKDGKTGERTIVYGEHTVTAVTAYLPYRQFILSLSSAFNTEALFLGHWPPNRGQRMKPAAISSLFARLKKETGIQGVCNPYSLRHLVGDHLAMRAGAPLPLVQEVMGHTNIATTMNYVHPDISQVKGIVALHSPLNDYFKNGA